MSDGNWNGNGNSWKADGKKMEKLRGVEGVEGTAVMRGSAGNARLISQMVYNGWFSF